MQSEGIIIKTEYVRFAKTGGFFKNFGRFFVKLIISPQNIVYIDVWKGQSPFQSPIAAKPLEASCEAARIYIYIYT